MHMNDDMRGQIALFKFSLILQRDKVFVDKPKNM